MQHCHSNISTEIIRLIIIILFSLPFLSPCIAQIHLDPPNGSNGIPSSITRSFVIKWASIDSAAQYEYIMSDNPLCFAGCPGDTRQNKTSDTTATEYNLQEDRWYYWITRIYYLNGDTSIWSSISSFLAKTPPKPEPDEIIKISPNPCPNNEVNLKIDWAVNPNAREIYVGIYSILGVKMSEDVIKSSGNRYQDYKFTVLALAIGTYIAVFIIDDNPNNSNNRITKKIIIL